VACFDDALGFIRSAVDSVSGKACYLLTSAKNAPYWPWPPSPDLAREEIRG
jgi:hypothetical protein